MSDQTNNTEGKLRLPALTALVVSALIAAGIFSLPQNMAKTAGAGAILIGWGITFVGMLMLAFVFQTLAVRKPDYSRHRGKDISGEFSMRRFCRVC